MLKQAARDKKGLFAVYVGYASDTSTGEAERQVDLCEFKTSLAYTASSMSPRAT